MKNHMIPRTKKARVKLEAVLDRITAKERDVKVHKRRPRK